MRRPGNWFHLASVSFRRERRGAKNRKLLRQGFAAQGAHLDAQVRHVGLAEVQVAAAPEVLCVHKREDAAVAAVELLRDVLHGGTGTQGQGLRA